MVARRKNAGHTSKNVAGNTGSTEKGLGKLQNLEKPQKSDLISGNLVEIRKICDRLTRLRESRWNESTIIQASKNKTKQRKSCPNKENLDHGKFDQTAFSPEIEKI